MPHKAISFFRAKRNPSGVSLTWYKATEYYAKEKEGEFEEFSIYRKSVNEFEFGKDYEEFFCDESSSEGDLIYSGSLPCDNDRKFTFVDGDVTIGDIYVYFVKSKKLPLVGPAPVKIRDPEVWWSYEELTRRINALCADYPNLVTKSVCGRTVEGRDIFALRIGSGEPCLGLVGAIHPGEAGPELIVSALAEFLSGDSEILKKRSIVAIPSVNIDPRERLVEGVPWYLRTNSAGVDLNRNFPVDWEIVSKSYGLSSDDRDSMTFRGTSPVSEPETEAVVRFIKEHKPKCVFSFHALAGICDLPALAAGEIAESDKEFYEVTKHYAFAYGKGLHPELNPDDSWVSYTGTEGGMGRWCWRELGVPGFDLEFYGEIAPEALSECRVDKTTQSLLREYVERHSNAIKSVLNSF